jgi:flagellar basal-body rod modification protein FlgD
MSTSLVSASAGSGSADAATTTSSTAGLANANTFLQLLVAQIKNQDPTNPTDSMQYVSQLAQFSELEQVIGIREDLARISRTVVPPAQS